MYRMDVWSERSDEFKRHHSRNGIMALRPLGYASKLALYHAWCRTARGTRLEKVKTAKAAAGSDHAASAHPLQ